MTEMLRNMNLEARIQKIAKFSNSQFDRIENDVYYFINESDSWKMEFGLTFGELSTIIGLVNWREETSAKTRQPEEMIAEKRTIVLKQ